MNKQQMKTIDVDDELYRYIASHTQHIGESASDILRRMLNLPAIKPQAGSKEERGKATVATDPVRERLLFELLCSEEYQKQTHTVGRFMLVLSALYHTSSVKFTVAAGTLYGRKRLYFAKDQHQLTVSGVHTKPQQIPDTPYWVITNTNTARKQSIVKQLMQAMDYPVELCEKICSTI